MDPITGFLTIAGLGISLFGKAEQSSYQNQEYGVGQNILALQKQENSQRQLAMQISARQQSLRTLRYTQQANARAMATGVNQGAMGPNSSAIAGGQAQASGEGAEQQLTTEQNLSIGQSLFGLQNKISDQQSLMAQLQSRAATFSGISSIGSALGASAGPMGRLLGNFFQGPGGDNQSAMPAGYDPNQTSALY